MNKLKKIYISVSLYLLANIEHKSNFKNNLGHFEQEVNQSV